MHTGKNKICRVEGIETFCESLYINPRFTPILNKLSSLKQQSYTITKNFQDFQEQTLKDLNKAMIKISALLQRQLTANAQLKQQLDIVKFSNHSMRKEVVQLREMIEEFVKSYNIQIEAKDAEIHQLKNQLGIRNSQLGANNFIVPPINIPEQITDYKPSSLQIIQQVSEYTGSCMQSIREISIPTSAKGSVIPIAENDSNITVSHQDSWVSDVQTNKSKNFLNVFRKNIDESIVIYEKKELKPSNSHQNSFEELNLAESDKINLPKAIVSPKNLNFIKNSAKKFSIEEGKENSFYEQKKSAHRRTYSEGDENKSDKKNEKYSRSNSKPGSKEKIKLASKMIDQSQNSHSKNKKNPVPLVLRPSVHLGGKTYLKKLAKQVRIALQQLKIWEGYREKQVKYQGEKKQSKRWGKGKLLYANGFEYEGSFAQNYKHGIGTVSSNGIIFYQGQWSLDQVSGQGYIKSLKNFSTNCPKILSQASYCGQLLENKLHGMGTLFLNQREKIVTKFVQGVPVGDFTYYSHSQIQFGRWY